MPPRPRRPRTHWDDLADACAVTWGQRLMAVRLARGMSRGDLAAALGMRRNTGLPTHWERGEVMPTLARRYAIAAVLDVPPDWLWAMDAGVADEALDALLGKRKTAGQSA